MNNKQIEELVDLMFDTDMEEVMKEKSTLEYIHKLQQENKQLKGRIESADEFCDRYMGVHLELFDMYELLNKIREILGEKEND